MKFQERFNEALKMSGKTQTQIAKAINVSKQCVTDYKTGKSVPSLETLCLLCEFLDISADYLLGISDEF
jgi:transcriptional regulator with XRE-family HTH domain